MGADDSLKNLRKKKNPKKKMGENSPKKKREENSEMRSSPLAQKDRDLYRSKDRDKKNKKKKKKQFSVNIANKVEDKLLVEELNTQHSNEVEDREYVESEPAGDKLRNSRKKKRKHLGDEFSKKDDTSEQQSGKSKKHGKVKKRSTSVAYELAPNNPPEKGDEDMEDEVYQMSSGDEDYSKGMKKWITQYRQSRPGLEVLQERIDDFIVAHEAQQEQAKIEREAQAAEDGWTVVEQQKGRKKTTEAKSGIAVGSVSQAAVLDKLANKKIKNVGVDFYRFQKREAHRNEILMLQTKFEEDKKRIQQLRAARKFRPY